MKYNILNNSQIGSKFRIRLMKNKILLKYVVDSQTKFSLILFSDRNSTVARIRKFYRNISSGKVPIKIATFSYIIIVSSIFNSLSFDTLYRRERAFALIIYEGISD